MVFLMASDAQFRCQHKNFKSKLNVNVVNGLISFKMFQKITIWRSEGLGGGW